MNDSATAPASRPLTARRLRSNVLNVLKGVRGPAESEWTGQARSRRDRRVGRPFVSRYPRDGIAGRPKHPVSSGTPDVPPTAKPP
jgi:hypothetical protein